jgi:hypothetical protein
MISSMSTYECPCCKVQREDFPGKRMGCQNCNVVMNEVKVGVVTKGAASTEGPKKGVARGK